MIILLGEVGSVEGTAFGRPKAFPQAPSEKEVFALAKHFTNFYPAQRYLFFTKLAFFVGTYCHLLF
ncbi:MAG: hypothetical protein A2007_04905 [Verrucomicrobia bacterium GWC2_42_7]|nr:MAG: hypothetical protein A2007_04905 [Verrucomicrobia bacterium GWC2_42_7]